MEESTRPWGTYSVIKDAPNHKVKTIVVNPGHRLSYQTHEKRSEYWVIVEGTGVVTIDNVDSVCLGGDAYIIEQGIAHRIRNVGDEPLIFIEVQLGLYFGEDDIVRLQDDYERE
jgi:mannose-6-phosphate isomerase